MSVLRFLILALLALAALGAPDGARAEDGYELWLRYRPVEPEALRRYRPAATAIVSEGSSPTLRAAVSELRRGLGGLLGRPVPSRSAPVRGAIVIGTPDSSPIVRGLRLPLEGLGREGFLIRSVDLGGRPATVIAANGDAGLLYGAFRLLRLIQTRDSLTALDIADAPQVQLRLLNHWDNLDRHVERGYAGQSLWDWQRLPGWRDPRYTDYARANASIGINGTVLNNVNSNALILTRPWLEKVAALADTFRPWGIRVYLSARFNAPMELGGLPTADPLDPRVRAWWRAKADEIYALVPDFGGFLVKANSEGQPGPQDYRRSHADGANMLAEALAPHSGIVMWRAFVYSADNRRDRAAQAYDEFQPLDGQFRDNVILQVKNGPIDFQPREPFHPLFGAMPRTPLMMEFQITKEYLGFATHLAFLGTMWDEVLSSRTRRVQVPDSTVARVVDGTLHGHRLTGMAGVANTGTDRNWSGSQFDQANWYAFGRLAWHPDNPALAIAGEWTRMTWGSEPEVLLPIVRMLMNSREAVVDYMTPLGLHHLMATGHHYGPGPWVDNLSRPDWNPTYYHRADRGGIGFDRTGTGSNQIAQYAPALAARWSDPQRVPEEYLLWFHHLPWDHPMQSGRTLWDELVHRYDRGVQRVRELRRTWASLEGRVDPARFAEVSAFLEIQQNEAQWWRDASIAYFQSVSGRPLPAGIAAPPHGLEFYRAIDNRFAPGQ